MKKHLKIIITLVAALAIIAYLPAIIGHFGAETGRVCYAESQGIEQKAGTTQGTVKRYVDISSPWSGAYLHEDMSVVGSAEIIESFTMGKPESTADDFFEGKSFGKPTGNRTESSAESNSALSSSSAVESESFAAKGSLESEKEEVLGVSIICIPTWLELF